MSRIGKKPVIIPAGVEVKIDGNIVSVKGPKGQLQEQISDLVKLEMSDGKIEFSVEGTSKEYRSQHGLARTLVNNMVVGVTEGYEKKLQMVGVGLSLLFTLPRGDTII